MQTVTRGGGQPKARGEGATEVPHRGQAATGGARDHPGRDWPRRLGTV